MQPALETSNRTQPFKRASSAKSTLPWLAIALLTAAALGMQDQPAADRQPEPSDLPAASRMVFINITTGPEDIFQLVAAYHAAQDALADGRRVALYFNGRGLNSAVKGLSPDLRLGDEPALWVMLDDLSRRGADVLISRRSARALNLPDGAFVQQAQLVGAHGEAAAGVFAAIPAGAVVLTY